MTDIRAWARSASRNYAPLFSANQCQEIAASADPNRKALEIAWAQGFDAGVNEESRSSRGISTDADWNTDYSTNPYRQLPPGARPADD